MNIVLRPLQLDEAQDVYEMFQEIPAQENGFENPAAGLNRKDFADFCKRHIGYSHGLDLKPGYVPDTYYILTIDGEPVGFCKLRHYLNDFLLQHGGHIGYGIRPSARGRKNGNLILQELLRFAAEKKLHRLLLTIEEDNIPSRKVTEYNGGVLEKIADDDGIKKCYYWIEVANA